MVLTGVVMAETVASDTLDVRTVATLAAVVLPLLVNLITKQTASDGLKSIINLIGSAIITVLSLWINPDGQDVTVWLAINTFIFALLTSVVAYKGVWKPTGISGSIAASTPNLGLGSPPVLETTDKGAEDRGQVDNDPQE